MHTTAQMPGGTIMKNAVRQLNASVASAPNIGPRTGPNTAPIPHITIANGCRWGRKVASKIACPIGIIGAPKIP